MNTELFLRDLQNLDVKNKDVITLYNEISALAMKYAGDPEPADGGRSACYLSMEFLVGRGFFNNLMELGVLDGVRTVLAQKGIDINVFEEIEDAALGNGGL